MSCHSKLAIRNAAPGKILQVISWFTRAVCLLAIVFSWNVPAVSIEQYLSNCGLLYRLGNVFLLDPFNFLRDAAELLLNAE